MGNYFLLAAVLLGLMAAMPFWDPDGFATPPLGVLALLAVAVLVAAFRGRRPRGR